MISFLLDNFNLHNILWICATLPTNLNKPKLYILIIFNYIFPDLYSGLSLFLQIVTNFLVSTTQISDLRLCSPPMQRDSHNNVINFEARSDLRFNTNPEYLNHGYVVKQKYFQCSGSS